MARIIVITAIDTEETALFLTDSRKPWPQILQGLVARPEDWALTNEFNASLLTADGGFPDTFALTDILLAPDTGAPR